MPNETPKVNNMIKSTLDRFKARSAKYLDIDGNILTANTHETVVTSLEKDIEKIKWDLSTTIGKDFDKLEDYYKQFPLGSVDIGEVIQIVTCLKKFVEINGHIKALQSAQINNLKNINSGYEESLKTLKERVEPLEKAVTGEEEKVSELTNINNRYKERIIVLEKDVDEEFKMVLEKRTGELKALTRQQRERIETLENLLNSMKTDRDNWRVKAEDWEVNSLEWEGKFKHSESKNNELRVDWESNFKLLQEIKKENKSYLNANSKLFNRKEELKSEVAQLKGRIEAYESNYKAWQVEELTDVENKNEKLNEELKKLKEQIKENKGNDNRVMANLARNAKNELEIYEAKIKGYSKTLDERNNKINELCNDKEKLRRIICQTAKTKRASKDHNVDYCGFYNTASQTKDPIEFLANVAVKQKDRLLEEENRSSKFYSNNESLKREIDRLSIRETDLEEKLDRKEEEINGVNTVNLLITQKIQIQRLRLEKSLLHQHLEQI